MRDAGEEPAGVAGRVLLAELLWTADGEPHLWSPYGNRRCRDQYEAAELLNGR